MSVFKNITHLNISSLFCGSGRFLLFFSFFFFLLAGCRDSAKSEATRIPPELKSFVDKTEPGVGEEFVFTLRLDYPPDIQEIFLPDVGGEIKGLRIIEPLYREPVRVGGRMLSERIYRLMADVSGSFVLPEVELKFSDGDIEQTLQTPRLFITVGGEKRVAVDAETMTDILDIKAPEPGVFQRDYSGFMWLAALFSLIFLAWFFWRRARDEIVEVPLSAHEWAFLRIAEIERADWLGKGLKMEYCVSLSEAVRGYLKRAFGLPAEEYTMQQLLPLLKQVEHMSEEERAWLTDFMIESDRAKFAGIFPSRDRLQEALLYFRDFIKKNMTDDKNEGEEVQLASA